MNTDYIKRRWIPIFLISVFLPLCATVPSALAAQATLAWDPNQDTDLEGYGIYYSIGSEGPPYKLFGYVTTAELTNPDAPSFAITGLQQGNVYYFSLTAYDTSGNESAFSEPVCAVVGDTVTACPSASSSSSASEGGGSGGGGGGGGCFIQSLWL